MLNKKEVKHIKAILKSKGICFLSNELLDHVCTDIERKLGNEISYKQVLHSFYDQQYISRLKKTNRKLIFIHLTKFIYMKIAIISLIIAAIIPVKNALFSSNSEDEKNGDNTIMSMSPYDVFRFDPPKVWPVKMHEKVSSGYGMRHHPILKEEKFHLGIDIAAPLGTPVLSSAKGEVIEVNYTKNYGNYVVIKHDATYSSKYSQLSKILVKVGQSVESGSEIGKVGSSGRSTAPHLHFEIVKEGKHIDPESFLKA